MSRKRSRPPAGDGPKWLAALLLAAAAAALVQGSLAWWPKTVDDAYITFHYAQNLVAGLGPTFNPGERVEGYTTPVWMALMAVAIAAGIDPVSASKGLGLACSAALVLLLHADLRRAGAVRWGAALGALLLASSFVLQIWAVSGMETNAYALLFFAGLALLARPDAARSTVLWASALLAAAALTRPEGLAFWMLGLVGLAAFPPGSERPVPVRSRLRLASTYAVPGLALLVHFLWRLSYYGSPLPNTYYVKTGGGQAMWAQGLHGLQGFVSNPAHLIWLAAAAAGGLVGAASPRNRRRVAVMAGATVLHLLYVVSVGDDGLRVHRFYVPVLAPLACLAGLLFVRAGDGGGPRRWPAALGVLAVALVLPLSVWKLRVDLAPAMRDTSLAYHEGNVKLGRQLARTRDADTLIAVPSAGAIPFYSRLPAIDMYGLNDRHIARRPFPERSRGRLMKWDNEYVLSRKPDLIVINRGYFRAGDPYAVLGRRSPGALAVAPMDRDLFVRVSRDGSYALRPIEFEDGSLFYVFERIR